MDPSAASFAQHFYWSLALGRSIGDSAREARVAVNYLVTGESIDCVLARYLWDAVAAVTQKHVRVAGAT